MDVDRGMGAASGEGLRTYYVTKIEELQLTVTDKRQNVRRLQVGVVGPWIFLLGWCYLHRPRFRLREVS